MTKSSSQQIVFNLSEDVTLLEVIKNILENNNLKESDEDFFNKDKRGKEPRAIIIKGAAVSVFEKKVPEKKIVEFLAKHLEVSEETAEKIVGDIKQKLIPFAKIVDTEKEEEIQKAAEPHPEIKIDREKIIPFVKKVETKNVEENAKKMGGNMTENKETIQADLNAQEIKKVKTVLPPEEKKGPDNYRESL
ncbi:MAG: hypothetical protein Q7S10_02750 [bacterium]|nr:hypothetical protein [bacterium]